MIRVMIVDDEILLRTCMQRILECEPDIEVPVSATDGTYSKPWTPTGPT